MTMRLNRRAYADLVAEDREWLAKQPRTLERDHVDQILQQAVEYEYGPEGGPAAWDRVAADISDRIHEPEAVRLARAAIDDWERHGVCPSVRNARHVCTWTCRGCGLSRDATMGSVSSEDFGQSRVRGPDAPQGVRCALFQDHAAPSEKK